MENPILRSDKQSSSLGEKSKKKEEETAEDAEDLEETLVAAMKNPQTKPFVLDSERKLIEFMLNPSKSMLDLPNLDLFERKIVHKLCDRFMINRDYVNKLEGTTRADISICKTEHSFIPDEKVEAAYKKFCESQAMEASRVSQEKKQRIASKLGPQGGLKIKKKVTADEKPQNASGTVVQVQAADEPLDPEVIRKRREYEEAKSRIWQSQGGKASATITDKGGDVKTTSAPQLRETTSEDTNSKPAKANKVIYASDIDSFDKDYRRDRARIVPPVNYWPGDAFAPGMMLPNGMIPPGFMPMASYGMPFDQQMPGYPEAAHMTTTTAAQPPEEKPSPPSITNEQFPPLAAEDPPKAMTSSGRSNGGEIPKKSFKKK